MLDNARRRAYLKRVPGRTHSPLRNLRRTRTITQTDLARLVGVTQETMSKYERGLLTPTFDMQALIAAILGSTPKELWPPKEAAPIKEESVLS